MKMSKNNGIHVDRGGGHLRHRTINGSKFDSVNKRIRDLDMDIKIESPDMKETDAFALTSIEFQVILRVMQTIQL